MCMSSVCNVMDATGCLNFLQDKVSIYLSIYLSGSDRKVSEYTVHHSQGCFGSERGIYPLTILGRWS